MSTTSKADRNAISGHVLRKVICAMACAAFALPVAATAEDVNIAADTATGVNLDASVGSTARVFPGVTVDNAGTGIGATTQAWTLTKVGS